MQTAFRRPNGPRRGVTLVEMLVVVALVVLMMVILVQIFQQATGTMIASRAIQDLDLNLRSLDQRIKQDLIGATARFTPPLNPADKLGYFEYGENAFADPQGEDTDDYLAFTTKAPEGQVFTGRIYIQNPTTGPNVGAASNGAVQPVTVTSQLAEVIYFLRNGNLYRRVFLIAPERQNSISMNTSLPFPALSAIGGPFSWLAANDISARPAPTGSYNQNIMLNDLGSLTNRENRAFRPRLRTDYLNNSTGKTNGPGGDGFDDDFNSDDIPDFYTTLYPGVFNPATASGLPLMNAISPTTMASYNYPTLDGMAFPYIFPGMYSQPETSGLYTLQRGWLHSLDPSQSTYQVNPFTGNHAPLITRDNLPVPNPNATPSQTQTWWGFPTWRETLSANWHDPVYGPNFTTAPTQVNGLRPFPPASLPAAAGLPYTVNFLPPVSTQFANDGAGNSGASGFLLSSAVRGVWDDDLIATNVRSFDVKALDLSAPLYSSTTGAASSVGYYDLGYAVQFNTGYASATPNTLWDSNNQPQGFGHAGRMPPLTTDLRLNPSRPSVLGGINNNNIGDNNTITRLTRVWDSWSTDYTNAPDVDIFYNGYPPALPIYPSYPAPYTSPLRGIQIQIRLNDPRGDYIKTLTIRHDFTDKL